MCALTTLSSYRNAMDPLRKKHLWINMAQNTSVIWCYKLVPVCLEFAKTEAVFYPGVLQVREYVLMAGMRIPVCTDHLTGSSPLEEVRVLKWSSWVSHKCFTCPQSWPVPRTILDSHHKPCVLHSWAISWSWKAQTHSLQITWRDVNGALSALSSPESAARHPIGSSCLTLLGEGNSCLAPPTATLTTGS